MGLFDRADLFNREWKPSWEDPVSPTVDQSGAVTGSTRLNPLHFATQQTADDVARGLGGTVVNNAYEGPRRNVEQRSIEFGENRPQLNAGLVANQLQMATRGRYNSDTGGYDREPMEAVQARLAADLHPPLWWQQQGQQSPYIGASPVPGASGNARPGGAPVASAAAPAARPQSMAPQSQGFPRMSQQPRPPQGWQGGPQQMQRPRSPWAQYLMSRRNRMGRPRMGSTQPQGQPPIR